MDDKKLSIMCIKLRVNVTKSSCSIDSSDKFVSLSGYIYIFKHPHLRATAFVHLQTELALLVQSQQQKY